ncbi:MAG: cytochrome P450 [Acidimicrobiales bacterium]
MACPSDQAHAALSDFNPFDPGVRDDPYTYYDRLRQETPAVQSALLEQMWFLSRHADCIAVLRDLRFTSQADFGPNGDAIEEGQRSFLFMDPPDHTRLRGLVSKAFTPRVIESLRPKAQVFFDAALDRLLAAGECDVVEDLAYPLPINMITQLMGVPGHDEELFKQWSRPLARSLDPEFVLPPDFVVARDRAVENFRTYFVDLIDHRRRRPGDDLLSALIAAEEEGDRLTQDELLSILVLLLVAGHETTVNLIGNAVLNMMRHRDQWERLVAESGLVNSAVEEVLRFDPPVQFDGRQATADIEIGGVVIPEGHFVLLVLGAANRDPAVFHDGFVFDISRAEARHHLSFGFGIHHCLGAPLARMEAQVALSSLAQRAPSMTLMSDEVTYRENFILRGLETLPLALVS